MLMYYLICIFEAILYATFLGSIVALFIIMIKAIFKKSLGIRGNCYIWLLLVIRLIIPYAPQSQFSVYNVFNAMKNMPLEIANISNYSVGSSSKQETKANVNNVIEQNSTIETTSLKTNNSKSTVRSTISYQEVICILWIAGVIAFGIYTISIITLFSIKIKGKQEVNEDKILKVLEQCKIKMKINKKIKVIKTDMVKSPAVFGILTPKLLLPTNLDEILTIDQLEHVILHEMAHVKRGDIQISCLLAALRTLHWFNPIIWYSFYKMNQDRELASDALALTCIDEKHYVDYGRTIIKLLESYKRNTPIYGMQNLINNKSKVKGRIRMISLFKKSSYKLTVVSISVLILAGMIMLTNAKTTSVLGATSEKNTIKNSTADKISELSVSSRNFKGYAITISNPKKISIATSKEGIYPSKDSTSQIANERGAIAATWAGGSPLFGKTPEALIIHEGKFIFNNIKDSNAKINIVGFTKGGILMYGEYTLNQIKALGLKEARGDIDEESIQIYNKTQTIEHISEIYPLITNGKSLKIDNSGVNPCTAIAQKEDGSIIFLVIDGRSAEYSGANLQEVQDVLAKMNAVNAVVIGIGSSSTLYLNGKVLNELPNNLSGGEAKVSSVFMVSK